MIQNSLKKIQIKYSLWSIFIVCIVFFLFSNNKTVSLEINPASDQNINTIIFDLGGVFFKTNPITKYKLIWSTIWQNPTLLYYLIVFSAEQEYFNLLHTVPALSDCILYYKCKPMPQIMADWQIDAAENTVIQDKIKQSIAESAYPTAIKNFFYAIAHFMFTPQLLADSQQPITDMINLATDLKKAGYKIYALSNWDKESFQIIHDRYPETFQIFDHFLISGHEKIAKPSYDFFKKLINTHQINPSDSIFIDDEIYNLEAADQLGINTILCTGTQSVIKELQKFHIIK